MTTVLAAAPLPIVPTDVQEFAEKNKAEQFLGPLAEAIGVAFPGRPFRFYIEADPEIEDEWRIIMEVDLHGWELSQVMTARDVWDTLRNEMRPVACVYCLRLEH